MVWLTDRDCDPRRETWYFFLPLVVLIGNVSLMMRQLLGLGEISMLGIVIGTIITVGITYSTATLIIKFLTGGCFLVNEWWLLLSVANYPFILIINELTYEVVSPLASFPFFLMYPAVAIKARDREAAVASVVTFAAFILIAGICYIIATTSGWWYYGVVFQGSLWYRIYQYVVGGVLLMTVLGVFVAMLPIKVGDFKLPGYYAWRYKDTAIITFIILLIDLWFLTYGGILRTVVNVGYGEHIVV